MRDERYQRTFTDEQFPSQPTPGLRPVDPEQKAQWARLHDRELPTKRSWRWERYSHEELRIMYPPRTNAGS
jgi:hypothetical protein